jgi:hypothetical protein
MPYASATEGTRVRRRGFLNAVARRRVCSSVILFDVFFAKLHELGGVVGKKLDVYQYIYVSGSSGSLMQLATLDTWVAGDTSGAYRCCKVTGDLDSPLGSMPSFLAYLHFQPGYKSKLPPWRIQLGAFGHRRPRIQDTRSCLRA